MDVRCRYLVLKDSFVAILRPDEGAVSDVLLMDRDFRVQSGIRATGFRNGLLISNLSRSLSTSPFVMFDLLTLDCFALYYG